MADINHSRTMRIDLIPDVPARASTDPSRRVVVERRGPPVFLRIPKPEGRQEDSHFQRLLQQLYDAAVITQMDGRILDVNARAEEFLQFTGQELRGMSVSDVVAGADAGVLGTVAENLENQRHTLIQAYCLRKDGSYFPAEIAVSKLELTSLRLCFFLRDITLRRQAEEMLTTEHNAIQNSSSGIAVVDLTGRIEYANPAMARLWAAEGLDGLVGRDVRELVRNPEAMGAFIQDLLEGDAPARTKELLAVRADGVEFAAEFAGTRNRSSEGENVGCVFSVVDAGVRKRIEEAERELERRRVMLESLGAACHHLGQPATLLMGNLELLQHQLADADQEARKLVQGSLEAMAKLSEVLRRLNTVNVYRTKAYLTPSDDAGTTGSRILDI